MSVDPPVDPPIDPPMYNVFPQPNSIPPATFYTMQGLAQFLNQNPEYKPYFVGYNAVSPYLLSTTSALVDIGYDPKKVPIAPVVKNMSQAQLLLYKQQLTLFQRVYAFNSSAYGNYIESGTPPVYFRFQTYKEYNNFKSAVSLVNKMYPFDAMAYGTDRDTGVTLGWVVPFPL